MKDNKVTHLYLYRLIYSYRIDKLIMGLMEGNCHGYGISDRQFPIAKVHKSFKGLGQIDNYHLTV